jgi:F-type H+-transporting ATPase subunit gamma
MRLLALQACGVAEELLKTEFDAAHLIFNRFKSAIAYKPTLATVLSPDVRRFVCLFIRWTLYVRG